MDTVHETDNGRFSTGNGAAFRLADVFRTISFLPGEAYGPHYHRRIEINHVTRGSCQLVTDTAIHTFRRDETMLIAPGVNHRFQAGRKGAALLQLEMLPEVLDHAVAKGLDDAPRFDITVMEPVTRIAGDPRLRSAIHNIIWELANRQPGYRSAAMLNYAQLILLLGRIAIHDNSYDSFPPTLANALSLMRRSLAKPAGISDIAAESGVSDRQLRKLFRTHFATSPHEYLTRLRIERAMSLLTAGNHSVKEVCFACGFTSPQYFSRAFKRITGMKPGQMLVR